MWQSIRWQLAQFFEIRWWRNYLQKKSPTDYLENKRAYWRRILKQLDSEPTPGNKLLDAGCGPAGVFILLAENYEVTALDPLLDKYEAQLTIFDRTQYPQVNFVCNTLERASFPANSFSDIYCFNAINHVEDWDAGLDALTHWASVEGRLVISSDVHRWNWLHFIFKWLPGDILHPQQHNAAQYREALQQRGWDIRQEVVLRRAFIFNYYAWVAEKRKN